MTRFDLAPGFTVACIGLSGIDVREATAEVGGSGMVLVCVSAVPYRPGLGLPDDCAVLRCVPGALPLLSHALDAVLIVPIGEYGDDWPAEARRVLAPGGALLVYAGSNDPAAERLAEIVVEAGFGDIRAAPREPAWLMATGPGQRAV